MADSKSILVVEDEAIVALDIREKLIHLDYRVCATATTGTKAVQAVKKYEPDLILMDIKLRGRDDGIKVTEKIQKDYNIPVIYISAFSNYQMIERAKKTSPYGYLIKPFKQNELKAAIDMALIRHESDLQIQRSSNYLSTTLRSIGDAVITTDRKGIITFMNPIAEKLTDWKEKDAVGESLEKVFKIINADTRKVVANPVKKVLKTGCIVGLANHTVLVSRKGKEYHIDDSGAPIKDDKGRILGTILVFHDVSERMKMQDAIQESEFNYRTIFETAYDCILVHDASTGEILDANRRFTQKFKLTKAQALKTGIADLVSGIPPYTIETAMKYFKKAARGQVQDFEYLIKDKKGRVFWIEINLTPTQLKNRNVVIAILRDIDDRKKAEEAARKSEESFRNIITSIPVGMHIYHLDEKGRLIFSGANKAADDILHVDNSLFIGKPIEEAFPPLANTEVPKRYKAAAEKGKSWHTEQINYQDKQIIGAFEVHAFQTSPGHMAASFTDITTRKQHELKLKHEHEFTELITATVPVGIVTLDKNGVITYANKQAEKILGLKKESITSRNYDDPSWQITGIDGKAYPQKNLPFSLVKKNKKSYHNIQHAIEWPNGQRVYLSINCGPLYDADRKFNGMIASIEDITENILQEQKYRVIVENADEGICVAQDEIIKFINPAISRITGYSTAETLGMAFEKFIHPDDRSRVKGNHQRRLGGKKTENDYAFKIIHKKGGIRWVEIHSDLIEWEGHPAALVIVNDISSQRKAQDDVKKSLAEKEVLLKEIHHRVKNNLQVISSLLGLQANFITDPQALEVFRDSQSRVNSMALIHQLLYKSDDFAHIDVKNYISELADFLYRSLDATYNSVSLKVDVRDIMLDINQAIPCGLIINELVSNCLKYAFPGGRPGEISVSFKPEKEGYYQLIVRDNGIGLDHNLEVDKTSTLGLKLVYTLAEQLDGNIKVTRAKGTAFQIVFPKK